MMSFYTQTSYLHMKQPKRFTAACVCGRLQLEFVPSLLYGFPPPHPLDIDKRFWHFFGEAKSYFW